MASPRPASNTGQNFEEWRSPKTNYNSFSSTGSISDSGTSVTFQPASSTSSTLSSSSGIELGRGCTQSCQTVDNDNESSNAEIARDQQNLNLSNTTSDIIDGLRMIHLATPQQVPRSSTSRTAKNLGNEDTSDSSIPEINIPKPPSAVSLASPARSIASANMNRNDIDANTPSSSSSSGTNSSTTVSTPTTLSSSVESSEKKSVLPRTTAASATTTPSVDGTRGGGDSTGKNDNISNAVASETRSTSASAITSPPRPARSSTPNSFVEEAGIVGPDPNISAVNSPAGPLLPRNCPTFSNAGFSAVDGNHSPGKDDDQVVPDESSNSNDGHVMELASLSSSDSSSGLQAELSSSRSTNDHTPFALKFAEYIQRYYVPTYGPVGNTSVETVVRRLQLLAMDSTTSRNPSSGQSSEQNINSGPIVTSPPPTPGNTVPQTNAEPNAAVSVHTASSENDSTFHSIQVPPTPVPASTRGRRRTPTQSTSTSTGSETSSTSSTFTPRRSPRLLSSSLSNSATRRIAEPSTPLSGVSEIEGDGNANTEMMTPTQLNYDIVAVYPRFFQLKSGYSVPKRSFKLLCGSILQRNHAGFRFSAESLESLQEVAEAFLVKMFENACKITGVRKSTTTAAKDMRIVVALKEPDIHKDLPPLQNVVKKYQKRKAHKPVRLFQAEPNNNDMSLD